MIDDLLDIMPPFELDQLMSAFNSGRSYLVKVNGWCVGVYQPPREGAIEDGVWMAWKE